ncbi:conserved hypothetical protein [Coccidioides posadasii str. Silveira]|uniref:Uncharacterized protein n=1 Tax=Coccidioides posadasii (strain RMSCC 757 / Silveira) TaxID=443226 RepID=E9D5H0_COCPS|nr:conserved hypothetical protein [Coccidioides posadasii str. Silveira]
MTEFARGLGSASTLCGLTTKSNVALPVGFVDKAWTKETSIKIGEQEVHAVLKPMRFPMVRNCTGMGVWMGRNATIQARKIWAQQVSVAAGFPNLSICLVQARNRHCRPC